jgi:extracellular factor (EF) 3-hydroxypalmitic acid methyl ester biosynthesis protein
MRQEMKTNVVNKDAKQDLSNLESEKFLIAFNEVFKPLELLEKSSLLAFSKHQTFLDGDTIIKQGAKNQAIYVLVHGDLRVVQNEATNKMEISRLGVGAVFGEMSFIDQEGASASVIAKGNVEVLFMDGIQISNLFETIAGFEGRFFRSLANILSRRLRATNSKLSLN